MPGWDDDEFVRCLESVLSPSTLRDPSQRHDNLDKRQEPQQFDEHAEAALAVAIGENATGYVPRDGVPVDGSSQESRLLAEAPKVRRRWVVVVDGNDAAALARVGHWTRGLKQEKHPRFNPGVARVNHGMDRWRLSDSRCTHAFNDSTRGSLWTSARRRRSEPAVLSPLGPTCSISGCYSEPVDAESTTPQPWRVKPATRELLSRRRAWAQRSVLVDPKSIDLAEFVSERLEHAEPNLLRSMLKSFVEALMSAEYGAATELRGDAFIHHDLGLDPRPGFEM